jgi:hypothetical protein
LGAELVDALHGPLSSGNREEASESAPKHLLFAVCHLTPPRANATLPYPTAIHQQPQAPSQ